jgi:hypothetical protein
VAPNAQTVRALVLTLASVLGSGCAAGPTPCASPDHCSTGSECLAHRCVALGSDPVAAGSQRLVLDAEQVAVVREPSDGPGAGNTGTGLPPTVTFGGPPASNQELLVRFPRGWTALEIDSAFLLLEPAPDADPTGADVPVRVALAASAWSPGSSAHAPGERGPQSAGLARTRPPSVLRVDVTAQLQALQAQGRGHGRTDRSSQRGADRSEDRHSDYGLVVRAAQTSRRGATYQTGAEGVLPRLDVYGRVRSGDAD